MLRANRTNKNYSLTVVLAALLLLCTGVCVVRAEAPRLTVENLHETYSLEGNWQFLPGGNLVVVIENHGFEYSGQQLSVAMTVGVAMFRKGETLETCIARADAAFHKGQEACRNQVSPDNYPGLTLID